MAIASLKRLSFNRNSFIEVKNLLFRNDQEKIDCFMRFWDAFTYSYIILLKVAKFYTDMKLLRISLGYNVDHQELSNQEVVLIRIIKFLRKKREEFSMFYRFHSFKDSMAKFIVPLSMMLKEFKEFIEVDFTLGTANLNRNLMLDMYNCDLSIFKNQIIPSVALIIEHLKKVGDRSENFDLVLVSINSMVISDCSLKIKKIVYNNFPIIKNLLTNDISIASFHIQRNEISMKFLKLDETIEHLFCGESFFGSPLITIEAFEKNLISDSLYILERLILLFTSLVNTTGSSIDYFFKISNFLELKLNKTLTNFKKIYEIPIEIQKNLRSSTMEMSSILILSKELINESIELKEYFIHNSLIHDIQLKLDTIKITYDHACQILESIERSDEINCTDKFQRRFKIIIDSLSCGILGLDVSSNEFISSVEGSTSK